MTILGRPPATAVVARPSTAIVGRPTAVAIVGAGPAAVYAADLLVARDPQVRVDLFEKLPTPYGLVRYGVAPDHPRIKKILDALHRVLDHPRIRLWCNVEVGTDVTVPHLRAAYDAVVIATGADRDADLDVPGIALPGSFGAADFVAWYNGHPDAGRHWPLAAQSVAVVGAGNVALDVTRILVKHPDHLEDTDIPEHVEASLRRNPVTDVHLFSRRGPLDVRFSVPELRELAAQCDVDVVVDPAQLELDDRSRRLLGTSTERRRLHEVFADWSQRGPGSASRRVHLHFHHRPTRVLGTGRVTGIEMERTAPDPVGWPVGTGELVRYRVGAVYRAVGYRSSAVPGVPFDTRSATIPERDGRVLDGSGRPLPGLHTTGWIRRGPIGLIGSTRSDAARTVDGLLDDLAHRSTPGSGHGADVVIAGLPRAVDRHGWLRIDAAERALGQRRGRHRTKITDRTTLLHHARPRPDGD